MMYLLAQYWSYLALALVLGLFVGWATCDRPSIGGAKVWLVAAIVLFGAGLAVSWLELAPGVIGHAVEVALLLFAGYVVGCAAGCVAHVIGARARKPA
jgi:hypothetical protein